MRGLWINLVATLSAGEVIIIVNSGKAIAKRGKVSSTLLTELSHLAKDEGITSACLVFSGTRLALHGIPARLEQRFRNTWSSNYR